MELKQCKNLKVFFCGTVPLLAHFISCYRGMSLTSVDFLVCLGRYTHGELVTSFDTKLKANLVPVWPDKLFQLVLVLEKPDQRSCGRACCHGFAAAHSTAAYFSPFFSPLSNNTKQTKH